MIVESIIMEMNQRPGEKTHNFLVRQQTAKNIINKMNGLEVQLGHVMADEEPTGRMGDTIMHGQTRAKAPTETKESIRTIT